MGLFHNRRLCLIICVFMIATLAFAYSANTILLPALAVFSLASVASFVLCVMLKRYRIVTACIFLCLCAVLLAIGLFAWRIDSPRQRAAQYSGKHTVTMNISDVIYNSESSSAFDVDISKIGFDEVSFKGRLVCMFSADLSVGDELVTAAELSQAGSTKQAEGILLEALMYTNEGAEVKKLDKSQPLYKLITEKGGITVVVNNIKNYISNRLDKGLGERVGGLAKGFLLGDRSDISTETVRDFRRTGLSHVFAVSGMHISLLLGALDIFLSKLYVHKYIRCALITVMCIPLLMLTGFAMSAVRAVLMLWAVYIYLALREMADTVTTLFCAIFVILILFPYSVYDLGLWMSFLATLGLVTLYPYIVRLIPKSKDKRVLVKNILKLGRAVLLAVCMTVVCSIFLLPIQWYVFGEISAVSAIANVPIYFLSGIFMLFSILCVALGAVPLLGVTVCFCTAALGEFMMDVAKSLAHLPFATVSLNYFFSDILVLAFVVSFAVLMAVRLKRKWMLLLPIAGFCICYTGCVMAYNIIDNGRVTYYNDYQNELISVTDNGRLAIVDTASATYLQYARAVDDAYEQGATSVDKIILTELGLGRISAIEYFIRDNTVQSIYIPVPRDGNELLLAQEIAKLSEECSVELKVYDGSMPIPLSGADIYIESCANGEERCAAVFVRNGSKTHAYADALVFDSDRADALERAFAECNTLIVSSRHVPSKAYSCALEGEITLVYTSEEVFERSKITGTSRCYINKYDKMSLPMSFK